MQIYNSLSLSRGFHVVFTSFINFLYIYIESFCAARHTQVPGVESKFWSLKTFWRKSVQKIEEDEDFSRVFATSFGRVWIPIETF